MICDLVERSHAVVGLPFDVTSPGLHEATDVRVDFILDSPGARSEMDKSRKVGIEIPGLRIQPVVQ